MRNTLAQMLAQSVQDMQKFKGGKIEPNAYMEWLDRYPVSFEVIVLMTKFSICQSILGSNYCFIRPNLLVRRHGGYLAKGLCTGVSLADSRVDTESSC